jgi:hypothetical protein
MSKHVKPKSVRSPKKMAEGRLFFSFHCYIETEIIPRFSLRNESSCLKIFFVHSPHTFAGAVNTFTGLNIKKSHLLVLLPPPSIEALEFNDDVMPDCSMRSNF